MYQNGKELILKENMKIKLPGKKLLNNQNKFLNNYENTDNKASIKKVIDKALSSFNRSIVFNNSTIGPDISW